MGLKWTEKHTQQSIICLAGGTLGIPQARRFTKREVSIAPSKLMDSNF